jgi:hypothetical protein
MSATVSSAESLVAAAEGPRAPIVAGTAAPTDASSAAVSVSQLQPSMSTVQSQILQQLFQQLLPWPNFQQLQAPAAIADLGSEMTAQAAGGSASGSSVSVADGSSASPSASASASSSSSFFVAEGDSEPLSAAGKLRQSLTASLSGLLTTVSEPALAGSSALVRELVHGFERPDEARALKNAVKMLSQANMQIPEAKAELDAASGSIQAQVTETVQRCHGFFERELAFQVKTERGRGCLRQGSGLIRSGSCASIVSLECA